MPGATPARVPSLERYRKGGYRKVPGWMSRGGCEGLIAAGAAQRELGIEGPICEIGVDQGRSLFLLCHLARPGETVLGVDPWGPRSRVPGETREGREAAFERVRVRNVAADCTLRMREADSMDLTAADLLAEAGGPLRLVHIDGSHKAPWVHHDLELANATLSPDGIIVMDDILSEPHPGVISGLVSFLAANPEARLVPFALGGGKAYLARPERTAAYRERFGALPAPFVATGSFFGHDVAIFAYEKFDDLLPSWLWRPWAMVRGLPGIRHLRRAVWRRIGYPPTLQI